jgi:hypothetical protein
LVRRHAADTEDFGFFIELPPGTTVTVNGLTYTNDADDADDPTSQLPFFIGPLDSFAFIELLAQPTFFFRTAANLGYTNRNPQAATDDEIARRSEDVKADPANITWTPITPETRTTPTVPPRTPSPIPGPPGPKAVENLPIDTIKVSDDWTDDGTAIEDFCHYLRRRLLIQQGDRTRTLIPRVLASVNLRQEEGSGFSFLHGGQVLRPGRTLITPIEHNGHHALATAQARPGQLMNIRIWIP